jgi:hypothetical protein
VYSSPTAYYNPNWRYRLLHSGSRICAAQASYFACKSFTRLASFRFHHRRIAPVSLPVDITPVSTMLQRHDVDFVSGVLLR